MGIFRYLFKRNADYTLETDLTKVGGTAVTAGGLPAVPKPKAGATTSSVLGIDAWYVSAWIDLSDSGGAIPEYTEIFGYFRADQAGTANQVIVEQGNNNTVLAAAYGPVISRFSTALDASVANHHHAAFAVRAVARYYRVRYQNAGVAQTVFDGFVASRSVT